MNEPRPTYWQAKFKIKTLSQIWRPQIPHPVPELRIGLKKKPPMQQFFEFCKLWVMSNHSQIWFHFHTGHILILILGKLILRRTVHKGFPCFSPVLRVKFVGCSNYLWLTQAFCLALSSVLSRNGYFLIIWYPLNRWTCCVVYPLPVCRRTPKDSDIFLVWEKDQQKKAKFASKHSSGSRRISGLPLKRQRKINRQAPLPMKRLFGQCAVADECANKDLHTHWKHTRTDHWKYTRTHTFKIHKKSSLKIHKKRSFKIHWNW